MSSSDTASGIHSLHLIGSKSYGGAERWVQRFSQALDQMGHPAEIGVRKGHELDQDLWHGLQHHPLAMRTVWDPLSKREVRRLVERVKPDIVQTYMGRATRLTHLQPGASPVHLARLGGYYKLDGYRHAHAWVGNTKGICDYLIGNGFPSERVFHIYNFYEPAEDTGKPESREAWGIPQDAWLLMTPGRQVPVKGHSDLLQAMSRLPVEIGGRPLRLMLLGDGPLQQSLREQARKLGIEDRLIWAGWQSNPTPFFRLCDLVVFPSLDQETFGNVILEAWAYDKPLVATAFRGAREILTPDETGVVSPCEDPVALAQAIERTLRDEVLRDGLVSAGRRELQRVFSKSAVMAQYIALYQQLTG